METLYHWWICINFHFDQIAYTQIPKPPLNCKGEEQIPHNVRHEKKIDSHANTKTPLDFFNFWHN